MDVVFYSGPSWEKWTPENINSGGIGGSETCHIHLAKHLQALGYTVYSFSDCPKEAIYDGVQYVPYGKFEEWITYRDRCGQGFVFISVRQPSVFRMFSPDFVKRFIYKAYLWNHDVHYGLSFNGMDFPYVTYVNLSQWHKKVWVDNSLVNDAENRIVVIPDGIDMSRFIMAEPKMPKTQYQKAKLIYTSSIDRGLDILLSLWPKYHEIFPNDELHTYYGVYNLEKYLSQVDNQPKAKWYTNFNRTKDQPNVYHHGRVGQDALAKSWMDSDYWFYPTYHCETLCITALEALASYTEILTTDLAALPTTLGNNANFIKEAEHGSIYTEKAQRAFLDMMIDMRHTRYWKDTIKGREWAEQFAWWRVARQWDRLIHGK